ncbi:group II intron reverse transcriptase/maturase [Clostridium sp. UBA6640]|uniref:group II intron reverse transcriptase/maturase n=1 Tax=Clostridium sp. UBA6640 TaxID=1946370 RepID=UPI0025BE3CB7|nr:group II intron reverse transcriptase/maturase [Clostridium sp. UBA6640]
MTEINQRKTKKKAKIRYNEYYDTQEIFDDLYAKSKNNCIFKDLMSLISSEENIKLAYRNIKKNKGSKTSGINGKNILDIGEKDTKKLINYIQNRLNNFMPHSVRRVEIPKDNGKTRPLGIPTIEDRIIQQCIKQILEPICEAKFHPHSYGFRPNRNTHHAIAKCMLFIHANNLHYTVDIDLKGFFDNVDHGKLIKQMWTQGIRDKNLLSVIKKMLKAEIKGFGKPTKGTPQDGILSPLLSNLVLNELDWWIDSQWEGFKTEYEYSTNRNKFRALKGDSNLKEMFIVRYADDFKIFCRDYKTAHKVFNATRKWLMERLNLEINTEKSKVTNLRRNYTNFLGIKLRVRPKGKNFVCKSKLTDKAKRNCVNKIKNRINLIKKYPNQQTINEYNSTILGLHGYYCVATDVSKDFKDIAFLVKRYSYNRLKQLYSKNGEKSKTYMKFYGKYNYKLSYIYKIVLFPIQAIKTKPPMNMNQEINSYTLNGRALIHKKLGKINIRMLKHIMNNPVKGMTTEYNDNRISLYVGQNGLCGITKNILETNNMEIHHIIPKEKGGSDEYKNLVYIIKPIHKLIHATTKEIIGKYMSILRPNKKQLEKINYYRLKAENCIIN